MRVHSDAPSSRRVSRRSALRLLDIERTDEIFPVLLEEIVALGHPRALIAKVNFETSEISSCRLTQLLQGSSAALPDHAVFRGESADPRTPHAGAGARYRHAASVAPITTTIR